MNMKQLEVCNVLLRLYLFPISLSLSTVSYIFYFCVLVLGENGVSVNDQEDCCEHFI